MAFCARTAVSSTPKNICTDSYQKLQLLGVKVKAWHCAQMSRPTSCSASVHALQQVPKKNNLVSQKGPQKHCSHPIVLLPAPSAFPTSTDRHSRLRGTRQQKSSKKYKQGDLTAHRTRCARPIQRRGRSGITRAPLLSRAWSSCWLSAPALFSDRKKVMVVWTQLRV